MKSLAILGGNSFALVSTTHEFTFIPGTKTWNIGCPDNLVSVAMQCPDSSYIKKYPKHAKKKFLTLWNQPIMLLISGPHNTLSMQWDTLGLFTSSTNHKAQF